MGSHFHRICLLLLLFPVDWAHAFPDSPRRDPVIHPQTESLGARHDNQIHAWIYFAGKGIGTRRDPASLNVSPRAMARRAKVGPGSVVSIRDLPVYQPYVDRVVHTGAALRHRSRWLNAVSVSATATQLADIARLPFVTRIDPVLIHRRSLPDDSLSETLSRNMRISSAKAGADTLDYGESRDQIRQINSHLAHQEGHAGEGIWVLMLDTGFFKDHESIRPDRIVAEWDFINNDGNTQDEPEDTVSQHDHGTYTLSALGGYMPGFLIGPAYKAQFLLAKTEIIAEEIQVEEDNFVSALEWGDSLGADVASSSLGYLDWYTYQDMDGNTAVTTRAVDIAVSLGMVCVTAAGNEGNRPWTYVIAPADADSVISVGAVNSQGGIAAFSSRGPTYDRRVKPEVCARGVATTCAGTQTASTYTTRSGTSLATPLVAGAIAVILSAHPEWTPMMIREALLKTASQAGSPDNTFGWGIIDTWDAINFTAFTGPPEPHLPQRFRLAQNYPNPFNSLTSIPFDVPEPARVTVTVFNLLGQPVATLVDDVKNTGRYTVQWEASGLASGIYIVRMKAGRFSDSKKMILIK